MLSHCSDKNYLVNSFFSEPQLQNDQFQYYTGAVVKGWTFNKGVIINNSSAWGYPTPYPCGNQACSIQMIGSISQKFSVPKPGSYSLIIAFCGRGGAIANTLNIFLNNKQVDSIDNAKIDIWDYKIIKLQLTDVTNTIDIKGTQPIIDSSTAIQLLLTDDKQVATAGVGTESSHNNNYMVYLIIVVILILLVAGGMYYYKNKLFN